MSLTDRQTDRQVGRQAGRQADRQTGRQTVFFSHDFSWTFFFFHGEKKNSESVSIAVFGALTEEDIDIIRQRGFNIV